MEEAGVVKLQVVDGLHLRLVEPLNALAVFPKPVLHLVVLRDHVGAQSVLLASEPESFVAAAVRPRVDAEAVLLVVLVLSLVHAAVVPDVDAHAFHVVVEPLAFVATAVQPAVHANPAYFVFPPVACVLTAVVPLVGADAMLAAERVVTFVSALVRPGFNATTVLEVVLPFTLVHGAIDVLVGARAVGLVVGPEAVVHVSVYMDELAPSVRPVLAPVTREFGAVGPSLFAMSVAESALPLASIDRLTFESIGRALLARLVLFVDPLGNGFAGLLLGEVLAGAHLLGPEKSNELACLVAAVPRLDSNNVLHFGDQDSVVVNVPRCHPAVHGLVAILPVVFTADLLIKGLDLLGLGLKACEVKSGLHPY